MANAMEKNSHPLVLQRHVSCKMLQDVFFICMYPNKSLLTQISIAKWLSVVINTFSYSRLLSYSIILHVYLHIFTLFFHIFSIILWNKVSTSYLILYCHILAQSKAWHVLTNMHTLDIPFSDTSIALNLLFTMWNL